MRLSLLAMLLLAANSVLAQNNQLLPVRINHQWGFIDTGGNLVREPKYNFIGDINLPWYGREHDKSGYFLVETNGLLGLIDTNLSEILRPAWREIQPVSPNLFIVAAPLGGYTVADKNGRDLLNATYEAIKLAGANIAHFFLVRQRGQWGVHRRGEGLVVPAEYSEIEFLDAGKGYFKTKKHPSDTLWLLTDWSNRTLLDQPQKEILGAGKRHLLTKEHQGSDWVVRTTEGVATDTLKGEIETFVPLNKHLIGYYGPYGDISVYVFSLRRTVYQYIDTMWAIDERLAVYIDNDKTGLIDSAGNIIPVENLSNLALGSEKLYRIRCTGGKWGLFSVEKGSLLPCTYDRIDPFAGKLAVCLRDGYYGVLNQTPNEILPTVFDRVRIEQNTIKCNLDDQLIQFYYDPRTGALAEQRDTFNSPIRVSIGFTGRMFGREDDNEVEDELNDDTGGSTRAAEEANARAEEERDTVPLFDEIKFETGETDLIISTDSHLIWRKTGPGFELCEEVRMKDGGSPKAQQAKTGKKASNRAPRKRYRPVNDATYNKMFKCRDVDWNIVVIEGDPPPESKLFGSTLGVGSGFYRAVIFDNRQEQLLPGLEILGIRLRDFRRGLPYAAFLTTGGQMGLIDKDGRQAADANGTPLRFEYIGQTKEGKTRVCVRGKKTPVNVGKEKQPVVVSGGVLSKMFNLQYKQPSDERKKIVFSSIKIVSNQNTPPLWGYLDDAGKTIIEPMFEYAADFKDSFAINRKNGKWGVVDHLGQPRIPFAYHAVKAYGKNWRTYLRNPDTLYFDLEGRYFPDAHSAKISGLPEGLFARKDKVNGKYGYVDNNGVEVIPNRFDAARDFSERLAAVREAGKWVFIDTIGNVVAAPDSLLGPIAEIGGFSEGLCWFRTGKGKTIGYLDRTGRAQIEPSFHGKPADFQRGVARVRVKREPALIDKNGRFLVWPGRYSLIGDFSRTGLAEVRDTAFNLRGLINLEGMEVIPVEYTQIISSDLGHAVCDGAYWQYLGNDGRPLLPLRSKEPLRKLTSNLAMVRDTTNGLWSYLFLPGAEVFLKDFRQAEPFQNGYAEVSRAVYSKDSLMIVSEYGSFLEPKPGERFLKLTEGLIQVEKITTARAKAPKFYYAGVTGQNFFHRVFFTNEAFRNGVAIVKPNTRFGAFNRRGWFVLPPKYAKINHQGNYLQTTPLLQGFVSHDGKNIIEPAFDLLELLDNGLLRVEWGDKVGYLRQNGEWVWPPGGLVR